MAAPHDVPTSTQLVEAVREWLERDVMAASDGRLRFHARVAANMLAMVERELDLGGAQERAHRERLERLGVVDDRALADAIRSREFDGDAEELRDLLLDSVVDKLLVANPRYLAPAVNAERSA